MPSFFEGLKRLVMGEPVFKPGEDTDEAIHKQHRDELEQVPTPAPAQPEHIESGVEQQGPKLIPEVTIERIQYRNNGNDVEVDVHVKNRSERDVLVDRITFLGQTRQVARALRPGEEREIPIYEGPRPNHRNYTNCDVQFRDETTGDYFMSLHFVEYQQEPDNTYVPIRIRFVPPIKDI